MSTTFRKKFPVKLVDTTLEVWYDIHMDNETKQMLIELHGEESANAIIAARARTTFQEGDLVHHPRLGHYGEVLKVYQAGNMVVGFNGGGWTTCWPEDLEHY